MLPPSILWISIKGKRGGRKKIWLPLFILWPIGMLLAILVYALYFLFFWIWIWNRNGWLILQVGFRIYEVICSLRGTVVEVQNEKDDFAFCIK